MKNLNKLHTSLLLAFLLFASTIANADEVEKTLAQKKFEVADNALLEIDHQFGKVKCTNWNENAISVKVTATVKASNSEKANKLIDRINIKLEGNRDGVSVESDFNERLFDDKKNQVSIDIEIMMPEKVRLSLNHKFGSAYIEVVSGETEIDCEYGSIEIKALKNEVNNLEIGFGEAKINYINMGNLEVSYSTMTVGEAGDLSIESSYSTCSIDKIKTLDIENEGGNVDLGEVENINLQSKFSEFKIGKLSYKMIADTEYGSLKVRNISGGFSSIEVENSFGSVNLYFDVDAAFTIEASMEFCNLNYPQNNVEFSKRIVDNTEKYYKGTIGGTSGKSSVTIESSFGNVDINL